MKPQDVVKLKRHKPPTETLDQMLDELVGEIGNRPKLLSVYASFIGYCYGIGEIIKKNPGTKKTIQCQSEYFQVKDNLFRLAIQVARNLDLNHNVVKSLYIVTYINPSNFEDGEPIEL